MSDIDRAEDEFYTEDEFHEYYCEYCGRGLDVSVCDTCNYEEE